jgi:LysM repeat protein
MRWYLVLAMALTVALMSSVAVPAAAAKANVVGHTVRRGETLSSIAAQYDTNVSSICRYNALNKNVQLTPGRKLGIPLPPNASPASAKATPGAVAQPFKERKPSQTWRDFVQTPQRAGFISLRSYTRSFAGNVRDRDASRRIAEVLAPYKGEPAAIDPRLVTLIARVSDTFGGRQLYVVSGYRPGGRSRHASGQAIDFTIDGVPNWALRDYLLTIERVGVGYYPNSTHVHLDVRDQSASWVDTSRPGQRAHYLRPKRAPRPR